MNAAPGRASEGDLIERLTDRLVRVCEPDVRVAALLVYGSRAAGSADRFSDLDIGLIATDAAYDDVVANLGELVRAAGKPLFCEDFGDHSNLHVIYADGVALELLVAAEGELSIDGPHRVLFDKTGVVERGAGRPGNKPDQDAVQEDVRRLVVWFWHDVEHVVTAVGRGQTWWAYGQLDELRRICLNLARLSEGGAVEPSEAYWKVDEAVSARRLATMEDTVSSLRAGQILGAANAIVRTYRELATVVAAAHGLDYPAELDRLVSGQLTQLTEART